MSLQIWLPLTKDLRQQGLLNTTVTNNGTTYSSTGGKLGGNYISTATNQTITVNFSNLSTMLANGKTYSLSCWVKPTGTPDNGWVIKLGSNTCGLWWAKSEARWVWNENDNGKRCANPTISGDYTNWHHLAIVVDKTVNGKITTKQYVDGALAANYPGSTWDCSNHSQPAGTVITISPYVSQLNDIRLYNHCLSPMEVKELAKGLVLHYPLNRQGWGQENLLKNSNFLQGTNGMQGYMATSATCTKQTDCMKVVSTSASGGFYTSNFNSITTGDMTTFSADVRADNNMTIYIGTDGSGNGSCQAYTIGTSWQRIHISKAKTTNNPNLRIYGNGTFYTKNLKYELGSIATPWCPNSSDELVTTMDFNSTTEYDCSGFGNNGTRTGTFTWTSNTPKYQVSTTLGNNTTKLHISGLSTTGFANSYSFAWWGKSSTYSGKMHWGFSDGARLNGIYNGNLWNTGDGSNNPLYNPGTTTQVTVPTANVWHHFVMVGDGSTCKVYKDGVLWGQAKTYKAISGTSIYFNGWDSGTSYAYTDGYSMSDFRIYATALSANDVKSLYQNSAYIDNNGNVYGTIHEV